MQTKAVKSIDRDISENLVLANNLRTTAHTWAITCGTCGRTCHVNDQEHRIIVLAIEADCEDLFRCDICASAGAEWVSAIAAGQGSGRAV